jgi:hypothetical protein
MQHAIAEKRVDETVIGVNRGANALKIFVEGTGQPFRIEAFGKRRKTRDIGKEHRHLPPLAAKLRQFLRLD